MAIEAPRFQTAYSDGNTVEKDGYHKPGGGGIHRRGCGCTKTTEKGAYRDVTVEYEGLTVHYYHQSPVVVRDGSRYRISSCGYRTRTTKERINRYLPRGYYVRQRDFEWVLETPDGERQFADGMVIDAATDTVTA